MFLSVDFLHQSKLIPCGRRDSLHDGMNYPVATHSHKSIGLAAYGPDTRV